MDAVLEPIIRSPRLTLLLRELGDYSAEERRRREQFYEQITEDEKAEFINGEKHVQSPVKNEHEEYSGNIYEVLKRFAKAHSLGRVAHEHALVCLSRNDYEPDVCFFRQETACTFVRGQMHFPTPDLVVEILSPSTASTDRGIKLEDYAAHGVTEYWIVDPDAETIEQYLLDGKVYRLAVKMRDGAFDSMAMSGLRFPVRAAFDDEACEAALRSVLLQKSEAGSQ